MKTKGQKHDDVVDSLLLRQAETSSGPSAAHPYYMILTRWLPRLERLHGPVYLPETASILLADGRRRGPACMALPRTPDTSADDRDPIHQHADYLDNRARARCKRTRSKLCIIWSIFVSSVVALAYALDLEKSWRRVEDQWAMMADFDGHTNATSNSTSPERVTRIWGHSHNDEMHGRSAFSMALGLGFGSIEADTYLVTHDDGSKNLMVGHEKRDLRDGRTLQSVYLDPILHILNKRNHDRSENDTWVGLLADDPHAEVQLVIDLKDDGPEMWPYVLEALEPLNTRGFLTTFSRKTGSFTRGPLTIIGTGNTPLSHVHHAAERVIFYDAPLRKIDKPARIPLSSAGPAVEVQIDHTISPMASSKFPTLAHVGLAMYPFPNPAISWMKRRTAEARRRGIASRWWGAANKPKWVRRRAWAMMREAQTDWINGDNLHDLARWLRRVDSGP